jgi:hypothetical protein
MNPPRCFLPLSVLGLSLYLSATIWAQDRLPGGAVSGVERGELRLHGDKASVLREPRELSSAARDRFVVPATTRSVRVRLFLEASGDGFAPLASWGDLVLAASFSEGQWTFWVPSSEGMEWRETEFSLHGDFPGWIDLDLVRGEGTLSGWKGIFVDGHLITANASTSHGRSSPSFEVHGMDFAKVRYERISRAGEVPDFARRALLLARSKRDREADHSKEPGLKVSEAALARAPEAISDAVRRDLDLPSRFMPKVRPGQLSFEEHAWFLTQTVNRAYYAYDPAFRVESAPRDGARLRLLGADYLPLLEGRDWNPPHAYENWGDYYIQRLSGYLLPEQDGLHEFFVSGDEAAALYLGTTGDPADLRLVASFDSPTPRYDWDRFASQRSKQISLSSDQPVYFELWHLEKLGADHVAVAWMPPGGVRELVPSRVFSSAAQGAPGTYPRRGLVPQVPLHLSAPPGEMPGSDGGLVPLAVSGFFLLGNAPIEFSDFPTDGWLFHALEGNGLGWMWTDEPNFPWAYSGIGWVQYLEETANPQWFYDNANASWAAYYASPAGISYPDVVAPAKWDFESGFIDWESDPASSNPQHSWWRNIPDGGHDSPYTGPSGGRAFPGSPGKYAMFEADYASQPGDPATLTGPWVGIPAHGASVGFYYHMYGAAVGTLHFEGRAKDDAAWTTLWSVSGQKHSSATQSYSGAVVDLSGFAGHLVRLRFRAVAVGGSNRGDIAIDDVVFFENGRDADGDGMTDGFELMYGFNPMIAEDPFSDADSDLFSLFAERAAGPSGLNGFNSATWSGTGTAAAQNAARAHAATPGGLNPVILLPNQGLMGVDTQRRLVPIHF